MTDRFIRKQMSDCESLIRAINDNIKDHHRDIARLERDRRAAGKHRDAYMLQQEVDRSIAQRKNDVRSAERELRRQEQTLRNLRRA